jgi:pyridoxine 5-phosphate synthase
MTKLSVNINKIATIRNARGAETPSVTEAAIKIQEFGGQGITIHPRPDERHITRKDVYDLKPLVYTEFNIEGNPHRPFIDMVLEVKPEQVTWFQMQMMPSLLTKVGIAKKSRFLKICDCRI